MMEVTLDLQISYSAQELQGVIADLDLMEKICGEGVSWKRAGVDPGGLQPLLPPHPRKYICLLILVNEGHNYSQERGSKKVFAKS